MTKLEMHLQMVQVLQYQKLFITGNVVSHIPQANNAGGYVNFSATDTVFKGASSIGTVSSVDSTFPEIVKYSGNIMYVENRGAVTRAADQIEDIKLIIQM